MAHHEEAITWGEKAIRQNPNSLLAHSCMAAIYSLSGRDENARAEAAEVLRIQPKYSLKGAQKRCKYKKKMDCERFAEGLRKAGLK